MDSAKIAALKEAMMILQGLNAEQISPEVQEQIRGVVTLLAQTTQSKREYSFPTENQYRQFFSISTNLKFILSTDYTFKLANPAFTKTLGYTSDEVISKSLLAFLHPEDFAPCLAELEKLNGTNEISEFLIRLRHLDGSYRVFSFSACKELSTEFILGSLRDVTYEKANAYRLDQTNLALENHAIIGWTDVGGTITEVNKKFCEISGYSREELIGQNHRILNSGAHSKQFFKDLWRTISSGNVWTGIIENKGKDGRHYWVKSTIVPIYNAQKSITGYMAIRFDITSEMENEVKLSKMLNMLNETGRIGKIGGFDISLSGKSSQFTAQIYNMFGLKNEMDAISIAHHLFSRLSEQSKVEAIKAFNLAKDEGAPINLELLMTDLNCQHQYVEVIAKVVDEPKGRTLIGVVKDITDLKNSERQLLQASKLASLGELSSGIAHEINNPLQVILSSTSNIAKNIDNAEKILLNVERIKKSQKRIEKIMGGFQRFSYNSQESAYSPNNLWAIMQEVLVLTEVKARYHNIEISVDCSDLIQIQCDPLEIEQVFAILVNNSMDAIKSNDEKWIKISAASEGDSVVVRVVDSGHGIPSHIQERMFQSFFTTKTIGEGTGLGLAIAKKIILDHDGQIEVVENSPNTCFEVKFNKAISKDRAG